MLSIPLNGTAYLFQCGISDFPIEGEKFYYIICSTIKYGVGRHFKCHPLSYWKYEQTCSHLKRGQVNLAFEMRVAKKHSKSIQP